MESQRKDGRGHWPEGKRRNPDGGTWSRVRLQLTRFLDNHFQPGRVSARALYAVAIGVSDRSVRRWIDGTDRPDEASQDAIAQWLKEMRESVRQGN